MYFGGEMVKTIASVTIMGDTTDEFLMGSSWGDIYMWVAAWSPGSDMWNGASIQIPRGTDQSASYTIAGLMDGTYEVWCWLEG